MNKHFTFLGRNADGTNLIFQLGRNLHIDHIITDKRMLSVADLEHCARLLAHNKHAVIKEPANMDHFRFSTTGTYILLDDHSSVFRVYINRNHAWEAEINGGKRVTEKHFPRALSA